MHYINFSRLQGVTLSLALLLLCSGCSGKSASASGSEVSQDTKSSQSSEKLRPNTPQVLIPDASQSEKRIFKSPVLTGSITNIFLLPQIRIPPCPLPVAAALTRLMLMKMW